jgi:uncharacterized Tic20 family protein
MSQEETITQNERGLAGLAHGSVLLGFFTGGIGGMVAALVIWLTQKEKSAYVAGQALQALVYQAFTFILTTAVWCCWGLCWVVSIIQPLIADPEAYESAPPATLWIGLIFMVIPLGIWGLTVLYGLYGAARSFSGHDFKYAIIGNWIGSQA